MATTVTVYRFEYFDRTSGRIEQSIDWATRAAIAQVGGNVLEDTAIEVEEGLVPPNGIMLGTTPI